MFSVSVCRGQNDRIERNDIVTKDKSVSSSDERLQRYLGSRYGQHSETRDRYAEAIQACGQIGYIDMTITEIARMFGHNPECLRSQLKLHFPEIMQMRDRIRVALGLSKQRKPGMSDKTMAKYAPAVELLRTTTLTIREVAERCGVPYAAVDTKACVSRRKGRKPSMAEVMATPDSPSWSWFSNSSEGLLTDRSPLCCIS